MQPTLSKTDNFVAQKSVHLMEVSVLQRVALYGNDNNNEQYLEFNEDFFATSVV